MIYFLIGLIVGLVLGWNLIPQPAWALRLYDRLHRQFTGLGAILFCLSLAGCSGPAGLPEDAYQAQADAVVVLVKSAAHGESDAPAPDDGRPDRQVGDVCDNCNGTGRSGDGLGRCNVCNGDGRIDREDLTRSNKPRLLTEQPPKPTAASTSPTPETLPVTIEMHVSQESASGWAKDWWATERLYFEQTGVDVKFVKEGSGEAWLKVCGNTCATIKGRPTREQLESVIEKVKQ